MIGNEDAARLIGRTAYDRDGEKIGQIDTVYVDEDTNEPRFALVNTGLFGMRSSFAPLQEATMEGEDLRLPHTKDEVKNAPNMEADGDLDPQEEQELFRYYGGGETGPEAVDRGTSSAGADVGAQPDAGVETDAAMTRSEEELRVGTTQHETGRVRLRKYVVTENVTTTVPVQREEVRVEREPVGDADDDVAADAPALSEEEHEVVLHEEEPVVEKRAVPKERVRLEKDVHTDDQEVEEEVAHEEIDLTDAEQTRRPGR